MSLLGTRRRVAEVEGRRLLVPARAGQKGDLFRDADYILTLDADSIVDGEYAMRLLDVMERPGNESVAVAQTPYSAVPRAPGALERVAGATTDIQHMVHQGFTAHGATFWVGANALLRRSALAYIETRDTEEGVPVRRFIQDRTVIEDTESSVDLIARGWGLHNHAERLAWSATPPDFGALVIQRRRWANGGLIILPKLVRHLLRQRRLGEAFLRTHYLASIAVSSVAVLALVALPIPDHPATYALPLAAAPFVALYARDLRQAGYRRRDVANVYALNLLLLPVNLGGVLMSLRQAVSGRKIPFGRTPKVSGRTAAPAVYVAAALMGVAGSALIAVRAIDGGRWHHALFGALTSSLLAYAVVRFVGVRQALSDLVRPAVCALSGLVSPPRVRRRFSPPADRPAVPARR